MLCTCVWGLFQTRCIYIVNIVIKCGFFVLLRFSDRSRHTALSPIQRTIVVERGPSKTETRLESVDSEKFELRVLAGFRFTDGAIFVFEFQR